MRPGGRTLRSAGPWHSTVPHREVYGLGWKKKSGACLYWRRDGPLGRPAGKTAVFRPFPAHSHCLPAVRPVAAPYEARGHGTLRCHIGKCTVWGGKRKAGYACIGVGTDHWAVRREKLPFFAHFRHIRTACQRCVQVAAPYEARGHGTLRCHIGKCTVWGGKRKAGHACIGVGTDHWAVRREKLPFFIYFRHIRTACQRCVQWPHPTKRGTTAPYGATGSVRFGVEKESEACLYWRRDGPLGRPAGKTSVFRPFPAHSHCLPAVRPGGRTLRSVGLRQPAVQWAVWVASSELHAYAPGGRHGLALSQLS